MTSEKMERNSAGKEMWGKVRKLLYKKATKMLWTVQCVDYLVMFGVGPPSLQSIRDSKRPGSRSGTSDSRFSTSCSRSSRYANTP